MKITVINGRISALGESRKRGPAVSYDYVSFEEANGQTILAKKVRVFEDVDRLLSPGAEGTFVLCKAMGSTEMHAARVGTREALAGFLDGDGLGKAYRGLAILLIMGIACLVIGVPFSLILIGLPFLFGGIYLVGMAVYAAIKLPQWRNELTQAAMQQDFKFGAVQRL